MALSADDKKCIKAIWPPIAAHSEGYGAEALYRFFKCNPQTTTYFPKFDFTRSSPNLKSHGKKVLDALTDAVNHLDNIQGALDTLSDLHAYNLRVDPANFCLLANNILTVIAIHHSDKFNVCAHQALDKFLAAVQCVLTSKYR